MNNFTSIIILNWNGASYLATALNSIYKYRNKTSFEIIIVDNGSIDSSIEVIKNASSKHNEIRYILNKTNIGFSAANNQGITDATGKYILLLNNDIEVRGHNWLDQMISVLETTPTAGIVGPRGGILNDQMIFQSTHPATYQGIVDYVEGWCLLFRKSLAEKIKLCRTTLWGMQDQYLCEAMFIFAEDSEFCQRSKMLGQECYQIANIPIHHFGNSTIKHQLKENPNAEYDYKEVSNQSTETLKSFIPVKQNIDTTIHKLLVIRGNARGDVLNTTPGIKALRKKYSSAFIGYVTFYPSRDVIELNYDIDFVFPILEQSISGFHQCLLQIEWNEVYYLGDNDFPSVSTILNHLKAKNTIIHSGHKLMSSQSIEIRKKRGEVKKPYSQIFAEMLNVVLDDKKPTLNLTSKIIKEATHLLAPFKNNKKTIALCLDSHWNTRTYPSQHRTHLLNTLLKRYNVILLGISHFKIKLSINSSSFINLLGKTSFELLCAILKLVDMIVTVDTATLHIGLTFEKPIISMWNVTEPYHVMSYHSEKHINLITDLQCSSCYVENCPKNKYVCYNQFFPERIYDSLLYMESQL